jgi:hypothetical protein
MSVVLMMYRSKTNLAKAKRGGEERRVSRKDEDELY